ncbi:unnamed protein product [Lampetra planeri]
MVPAGQRHATGFAPSAIHTIDGKPISVWRADRHTDTWREKDAKGTRVGARAAAAEISSPSQHSACFGNAAALGRGVCPLIRTGTESRDVAMMVVVPVGCCCCWR